MEQEVPFSRQKNRAAETPRLGDTLLQKDGSHKSGRRSGSKRRAQMLLFAISFVIFADSPGARCADSLIDPHFLLGNANTHIWRKHGHT